VNRKEGKGKRSYAWVVRSLWKIKEDVKVQDFPSYLEPASVKFLIDVRDYGDVIIMLVYSMLRHKMSLKSTARSTR
jgi:hypothetical protein